MAVIRGYVPCRACGASRNAENARRARRPGDSHPVALCRACHDKLQADLTNVSSIQGLVQGDEVAWGPRRARLGQTPSPERRRILIHVLPTQEGAEGYARLVAVRDLRRLTPPAQSRKEGCASA